jgi:hypothetical protein
MAPTDEQAIGKRSRTRQAPANYVPHLSPKRAVCKDRVKSFRNEDRIHERIDVRQRLAFEPRLLCGRQTESELHAKLVKDLTDLNG